MKSLKKNVMYNSIYQFLIVFLPFITAPYLSRVIGASGVGLYSYNYSVAQYFVYFSLLGLNNYGNRSIASVGNDFEERSKVFSEIYSMQIITSMLSTLLYLIYVVLVGFELSALIMTIYVISAMFDINWLFFGTENFKMTVIRNAIIKLLSMVAIFVFVKNNQDTYTYIIIMALSSLVSQLALWPFVKKIVRFSVPSINNVLKHFKANLILFIPVIAVSIYKIMDKIMLGVICSKEDVGYYEYAEKIYNIPLLIITAIGTVMLPRMSYLYSNNKNAEAKKYVKLTVEYVLAFANAAMFGIFAIADKFIVLYYGEDFSTSSSVLKYLSVTIVFLACGNVVRTQVLIPMKKDKVYITSAIYGAIINFAVNILLIPYMGILGAAVGTIVAELTVFVYQIFNVRKEVSITEIGRIEMQYFALGISMFLVVSFVNFDNKILEIIGKVFIGGVFYIVGFCMIYRGKYKTSFLKKIIKK